MSTLRPTIDVDARECTSKMQKERRRIMMKHVHASHEMRRITKLYREYQVELLAKKNGCSIRAAKELSEDPDPYKSNFIFYCVGV